MWRETLIEGSIFREWALNMGRRHALERTAHFLCEMALRLSAAGLADKDKFELPVNQEQMGDVLGLTSVHVNRTLQKMDGVIKRDRRTVMIQDWNELTRIGDFDPAYLHLNGASPAELSGTAS